MNRLISICNLYCFYCSGFADLHILSLLGEFLALPHGSSSFFAGVGIFSYLSYFLPIIHAHIESLISSVT